MIRRIQCWFMGHVWVDRWTSHAGDGKSWLHTPMAWYEHYGLTVLIRLCSRCGCTRERRFVGSSAKAAVDSGELQRLRKMAGLD